MSRRGKITVSDRDAILRALATGTKIKDLAQQYHVSYAAIWRLSKLPRPAAESTS